jgi:ADP-ribose pyrophosphatase YjhB (NUDIX family)
MPHIHNDIDFTIEVYVVYQNKVLLRKHDKYGIWLSVGGHIELDEDSNQAAVREVKEEVGLDVQLFHDGGYSLDKTSDYQELIPPQYMNLHRINEKHEHVCLVYFAKATTDELTLSEEEKSEECAWLTKEDILSSKYDLRPHVKMYALSALEKLATR